MTALLSVALACAARGWPVFPCAPNGKAPAIAKAAGGNGVLDATTSSDQICAWWAAMPHANIGIATGAPGPDVADFDTDDDTWKDALATLTRAGLLEGRGDLVQTRSGGIHVYFSGTAQRSTTLRSRTGPSFPVDFKAAGGYVIAPGCHVAADDKPGGTYDILSPGAGRPAELDWRMARDLLIPPPPFRQPAAERAALADTTGMPGADFAAQATWPGILADHGWQQLRQAGGGVSYWRRPGKTRGGSSASTRDDGGLWVFSSSTDFEQNRLYSKFGAWTVLHGYGDDYRAAAAQLRRDGYGTQPPAIAPGAFQQPAGAPAPPPATELPPRTSWHPVDLTAVLDGDASGDPLPAQLARADGHRLIYAAKVNALIGESESGKTWVALIAVAQALAAGEHVVYLDFEDSAAGITGRLRALGATRDDIAKLFHYAAPDEPLTAAAAADISETLATHRPALAVVDGVNAAMTLLGLNLKDNKDATDFSQRVLRPLKRTGAAVLTIDHVTKNKDDRGSYAIGAQAKRADIDGAAIIVEAIRKFGRGQAGELRLTVSKDRPGHVRAISAGAEYAGTARLISHDDGTIAAEINAPDLRPASEKPPWRPTGFMERISVFLEQCETGASLRAIRESIGGKSEHLKIAILRLSEEHYITLEAGPRNATIHRHAKPFRQEPDTSPVTVTHRDPTVTDDLGSRSSGGTGDRDPETGYKPSAYPGGGHGRAAGGEVTVTVTATRGAQ